MLKTGYKLKGQPERSVEHVIGGFCFLGGIKAPKHPDCPQQTSLVVFTIALTTIDGAE
jgi:hypothetical protein